VTAFLITGIPGAGKTTVARLLAGQLERAAHIEADRLQEWIVSGGLCPDQEPRRGAAAAAPASRAHGTPGRLLPGGRLHAGDRRRHRGPTGMTPERTVAAILTRYPA
jgi:predicted kinase